MIDPTARIQLGRTSVNVSRLGFGSAPLGGLLRETTEQEAQQAVDAAVDAGISYFDVAPQYGGGMAERRLGRALGRHRRGDLTLSTKVGKLVKALGEHATSAAGFVGAPPHEIIYDYSYDGTLRSFEQSLHRLNLDRIDILLVHDVNRKYHGERVMERFEEAAAGSCRALKRLRDEGAIGAFGSALNELDVSIRFVQETEIDCIMLPQRFTLLDQSAGDLLLPLCLERQVGVLVAGPFDSGILATGAIPGATYNYQPASAELIARVTALEQRCAKFGISLQAAALQFPYRHPAVTSVVAGMRNPAEVANNIDAIQIPIPADFWEEIALDRAVSYRR